MCELNIAYASKLNEIGYWVDYPHNLGILECKLLAKNDFKGEEQLIQYSRDKGAFKVEEPFEGNHDSELSFLVSHDHLCAPAPGSNDICIRPRSADFLGIANHLATSLA